SGGMTRNLISNFFYGVSELMRLAAEEKKADNKLLEEIANEFKLTLDQRDYLDVFPLADGLVPGVEAKYGSGKIELKLNQFHKLSVLKKMASRLPGRTEDSTKAYVETARCSLVPEL